MKHAAIAILTVLLGAMLYTQASGQEGTIEYRDAQGTAFPVRTVVKSEQMQAVIDRLTAVETQLIEANAKLDAMLAGEAPQPEIAVNINTATYDELLTVPGIGPVKAGSIIADRGQSGEYSSWADLMRRVAGIGPATIADIQAGGAVLE